MICTGKLAVLSRTLTQRTKTVLNQIQVREMEQVLVCKKITTKNSRSRLVMVEIGGDKKKTFKR